MTRPELTEALRAARRALEHLPTVTMQGDFSWHESECVWALPFRVTTDREPTKHVPRSTDWYAVVKVAYPTGSVCIYPANVGGITATFPHQLYNREGTVVPWRSGEICTDSVRAALRRPHLDHEPRDNSRLAWRVDQAVRWIESAATNSLVKPGEDFELPCYPATGGRFAFQETNESFGRWCEIEARQGWARLRFAGKALGIVEHFETRSRAPLVSYTWGERYREEGEICEGVWIRVDDVVVLDPWQPPSTWGELSQHLAVQGVDLLETLKGFAPELRDGSPHFVFVGFPIPERAQGAPVRLHWLAFHLPALATGEVKGFRPSERNHWRVDRQRVFAAGKSLSWVPTENWSDEELTGRGRYAPELLQSGVVVLGVGALGSVVAELLVRGGLRRLVLVDEDRLAAGNLVRHTLTLDHIGDFKAQSLASRLNSLSPHAQVSALSVAFPSIPDAEDLRVADLVIDCTGSGDVLDSIETYGWRSEGSVISLSLGLDARRLFCFRTSLGSFKRSQFTERFRPWHTLEREDLGDRCLPREGIGCWHPVFPARVDHVWLFASLAIQWVEQTATDPPGSPSMRVFERSLGEDASPRVRPVEPPG